MITTLFNAGLNVAFGVLAKQLLTFKEKYYRCGPGKNKVRTTPANLKKTPSIMWVEMNSFKTLSNAGLNVAFGVLAKQLLTFKEKYYRLGPV